MCPGGFLKTGFPEKESKSSLCLGDVGMGGDGGRGRPHKRLSLLSMGSDSSIGAEGPI